MKFKRQAIASFSLILISTGAVVAQTITPSPSPSTIESSSPSSSLSERQRDEVEQILKTQFQESASVNEQIESIVSARFNLTVGLLTVLTAILTLTPVLIGYLLSIVRRSIKDHIIEEYVSKAKEQMENTVITETIKAKVTEQLKQKVEDELTDQLNAFKQRLEAFKQMLVDYEDDATKAQSDFSDSLESLSSEVEAAEKRIASAIVSDEQVIATIASSPELISKIAGSQIVRAEIAASIAQGKLQVDVITYITNAVKEEVQKRIPFGSKKREENQQ